MGRVISLLRFINTMSLDVASGAAISALFFAKIIQVILPVYSVLVLFLVVWIIYTTDHLLDVINLKHPASSSRHRFHQRNKKWIFAALIGAILMTIFLLFFLPVDIIKSGFALFALVIAYVLLLKRLYAFKELLVAMIYVAGVSLPAWSLGNIDVLMLISMVIYFFLAWINLIVFSWYDKQVDEKDNHVSIASLLNDDQLRHLLITLFAIMSIILCAAYFYTTNWQVFTLFVAMALPLFALMLGKNKFSLNENFRVIGDAVFLFPVFYWLI